MDAPVVVKPDALSKKASAKFGMQPDNMKGIAPSMLPKIQQQATTAKTPRMDIWKCLFLQVIKKKLAITQTTAKGIKKGRNISYSLWTKPTVTGRIKVVAIIASKSDKTRQAERKFEPNWFWRMFCAFKQL